MDNFDRKLQSIDFMLASHQVIIFKNAANNGMTNFLLNELKDKRYIFVTENSSHDIVIGNADKSSKEKQNDKTSLWNNIIELQEYAKYATNLFYFVPEFGTFLRNTYIEFFGVLIKKSNDIKYSFEDFLDEYLKHSENLTLYIIAEHVEEFTLCFINKLKALVDKYPNIILVLTCDEAAPSAELCSIFHSNFTLINFSKPGYKEALEIFNGLNLNPEAYNEEMYVQSSNLMDFLGRYETRMQELNYIDPIRKAVRDFIAFFNCKINNYIFDKMCEYIHSTIFPNNIIDSQQLLNIFLQNRILSQQGSDLKYNLKCNYPGNNAQFKGFVTFLLDNYREINLDALYYIFTLYPDIMDTQALIYMVQKFKTKNIIGEILAQIQNGRVINWDEYCIIYKHLFNLKYFDIIPKYTGPKSSKENHKYRLLKTIAREKAHGRTSPTIYKNNIKRYVKINVNFACLNEILLLDYSINHNRKFIKQIIERKGIYNINNFITSEYYYILQSIAAFYIDNDDMAMDYYNKSIDLAPREEKFLFLNNKLAYLLSKYQTDNSCQNDMVTTFNAMSKNFQGVNHSFIEHNILLYQSMIKQENMFPNLAGNSTQYTWDLYKKLNYMTCKYVFEGIKIEDYILLKNQIRKSNRLPTKTFYYYNLYLIAKEQNNKKYIKIAKRFLDHNVQFKSSALGKKYKKVKTQTSEYISQNKKELVKFGLIFSRLFDLDYLLKSMAETTK